jgi:hypothetical protein
MLQVDAQLPAILSENTNRFNNGFRDGELESSRVIKLRRAWISRGLKP